MIFSSGLWLLGAALLTLLFGKGGGSAQGAAQKPVVYLISSCPIQDFTAEFPARLHWWVPDEQKLNLLRTVVDSEIGTFFTRAYFDERMVVIRELGFREVGRGGTQEQAYALVHMDQPWKEKSVVFRLNEGVVSLRDHLFRFSSSDLRYWMAVAQSARGGSLRQLEGVELSSSEQSPLEWRDYRHVRLYGAPGGAVPGGDTLLLHATASQSMEVRRGRIWTDLDWPLPDTRQFEPAEILSLQVNQSEIAALTTGRDRDAKSEGLGSVAFHVQDKRSGRWHRVEFPGGFSSVRAFEGPWLAGYVADQERAEGNPGAEERRTEPTETGTPVDSRFSNWGIHLPGIVFLYNVHTRRYVEFESGQADTEILLLDEPDVYYRVNDRLYTARIGVDALEDHALLAQADFMPDVHWAFLGPPPPE